MIPAVSEDQCGASVSDAEGVDMGARRRNVAGRGAAGSDGGPGAQELGSFEQCDSPSWAALPDFESASTYIPSLVLLVWLNAHSGATCLQSVAPDGVIVIVSFLANWILFPMWTGAWKQVRYGMGMWLAWICYGELALLREAFSAHGQPCDPQLAPSGLDCVKVKASWWRYALQLALGALCVVLTVTNDHSARNDRDRGALFASGHKSATELAVYVCVCVSLLFPLPESSFAHLECVDRILKASVFGFIFSFMYLCGSHRGTRESHGQRTTVTSAWVLMVPRLALLLAPLQILLVVYLSGILGASDASGGARFSHDSVDVEQGNVASADSFSASARSSGASAAGPPPPTPPATGSKSTSADAEKLRSALAASGSTSMYRGMPAVTPSRVRSAVAMSEAVASADVDRLKKLARSS